MTISEVKTFVESQIGGRWKESNLHGVDIKTSLVSPEKIKIIQRQIKNGVVQDKVIEVWLVLEERPKEKGGYRIIFDDDQQIFGLASPGFPSDAYPVLVGFYGDFWTTFKGM